MITADNRFFNQQWGLWLIKAPEAWQALNGGSAILNGNASEIAFGSPNIRIAVMDTGIETKNNLPISPALKGNLVNGNPKLEKNIVDKTSFNAIAPKFDFVDFIKGSHGEPVSAIATAKPRIINHSVYDGEGVIGVAPNCALFSAVIEDARKRFFYMYGLAGLEYALHSIHNLNNLYNEGEEVPVLGLVKSGSPGSVNTNLYTFLNNSYADIFNISLKINDSNLREGESYSVILFNEITFLGRNGRGCVIVATAGNDFSDIEPTPGEFLNEMAASNKPIIVGAVSVDDNYNWLTGTPAPNAKKSSYSNFGRRIDVCAPGGGSDTNNGQQKNNIFTGMVRGGGELNTYSVLKLSVKSKAPVPPVTVTPPNSAELHYLDVKLEFDNVNGVFKGQKIVIGNFSSVNSYEVSEVKDVVSKKVTLNLLKVATYNSLVDAASATPSNPRTVIEFYPFFTEIEEVFPNDKKRIKVKSTKGAFPGARVYIGSLGDISSGSDRNISGQWIDQNNNEITLSTAVTANTNQYVVFSQKSSKVLSGNTNGSLSIVVDDIEGFFAGGEIFVDGADASVNISSVDKGTRTITFISPLVITSAIQPAIPYAVNYGTGNITQHFNGTSAAVPFVSGVAALVLSANPDLSAAEVKHIIKETASSTLTDTSGNIPAYIPNIDDGYDYSTHYGTGLVDAEAAVQMAKTWHTSSVQKPEMRFYDNTAGTTVPDNQPVDSPDIWIKPLSDGSSTLPTPTQPFDTFDTIVDQKVYVRVRNTGTRKSFKECDLRLFLAFTDDVNPPFPFPGKWYHQDQDQITSSNNIINIGIKSIPIIPAGGEAIITFEQKDIRKEWDNWNPLYKKAYLLAHIAPFDGVPGDVSLTNIRGNKNLTCRPVNATHFNAVGIADDGTETSLLDEVYNLGPGPISIKSKKFRFGILNITESRLNTLQFSFARKINSTTIAQTVVYKKLPGGWGFDVNPTGDWITIPDSIQISDSTLSTPDYKNASLEFIFHYDSSTHEFTCDVIQ